MTGGAFDHFGQKKAGKNMICRLTLFGVLIQLFTAAAQGQSTVPNRAEGGAKRTAATVHSVDWKRLPLRDAVARLNSVANARVFLDRRVDPDRRIDLEMNDAGVEEIIARLTADTLLGHARLERLYYVGPPVPARRIAVLASGRRRDVAALATKEKQSLLERRRIVWPRLTEPRGLVTRLAQEYDWRIVGGERIPHDLWAAGELPAMALADQLTVLLAGFDLTYRVLPDSRAIEVGPVDWKSIDPAPAIAASSRRAARPAPAGRQVFTLRIENQPVGKVLEQLGRRLGWQLSIDEAALKAAGRSLDDRVSFRVENADEDQMLVALLAPAGLQAERDGKTVKITPR